MNEQQEHAEGWYDNPEGEGERYWDGSQWTDRYRQPDEGPKWWTRKFAIPVWLILGGAIALIGLGSAMAGEEAEEVAEPAETVTVTATETVTAEPQQQQEAEEPADEEGDASAQVACEHFRNVAGDAAAGILSDAELREKLQEVHDSARVSDVAGVRSASQEMLAAATSGSFEDLGDAVTEMSEACASVGY